MFIFAPRQSYSIVRLILVLGISGSAILSGCDSPDISSESTVGNNNIAQTDPDIINRNSMEDVANAHNNSEDSDNKNIDNPSAE